MKRIRIVLAGELQKDDGLFQEVDRLASQIGDYLNREKAAKIQMLVSSSYTGGAWLEWNETRKFPICTYIGRDCPKDMTPCEQTVKEDTALRNLIGEALCDKADAILAVWNEDVTELSGATWELIKIAYGKGVPCIWISTKSKQAYCLWESYYKEYTPEYLKAVMAPLQKDGPQPLFAEEKKERILAFWEKRRLSYLKKYKADTAVHPTEEDCLMKKEFEMEPEYARGEAVRRVLLEKFEKFDGAAIELNSRFQAMLYQRSILPFLTTIFLAFGFYAETLIGKTLSIALPDAENRVVMVAGIIAGTGFLVHGFLNLYVYRLSKSSRIEGWQRSFSNDRFIAEILRVLIHFMPYGVELDLRRLCAGDREIYGSIRHLADQEEPSEWNVDRKSVRQVLVHVKEMLNDQLRYHEASKKRYETIVTMLEKMGRTAFYIGFGVVLLRGALQFFLSPMAAEKESPVWYSIVRSFLNMAALLTPAWAGYFSTKVQQNNFRYNLDNHIRMADRLSSLKKRVETAMGQEEIPFETFQVLAEEVAEAMLVEDTTVWRQKYMSSGVKPL